VKYLGDVSSSRTADYRGTADLSESDSKNWFQEETFSRETKKYLRQEFWDWVAVPGSDFA